MAADWALKLFILKLDIEKAFDTVIQSNMRGLVFEKVAVKGGLPWEARGWMQLLQSDKLTIATQEAPIEISQTNGLRQGSPDSTLLCCLRALLLSASGGSCRGRKVAHSHCLRPGELHG